MSRHYPTFEELMAKSREADDERAPLLEVNKSLLSILSNLIMFAVSAVIVVAVNYYFPNLNLLPGAKKWYVAGEWLAVIPVILFIEIIRQYHDDLYIFSIYTMTARSGRLSLRYTKPNIRYVDVRIIEVQQDFVGRIFNYGDIMLDTAAQEHFEIFIQGVRAPRELADLAEELRQESLRAKGGGAKQKDASAPDD